MTLALRRAAAAILFGAWIALFLGGFILDKDEAFGSRWHILCYLVAVLIGIPTLGHRPTVEASPEDECEMTRIKKAATEAAPLVCVHLVEALPCDGAAGILSPPRFSGQARGSLAAEVLRRSRAAQGGATSRTMTASKSRWGLVQRMGRSADQHQRGPRRQEATDRLGVPAEYFCNVSNLT